MVLAPASMALSTQRQRKSWSVREPSSGLHSTSSAKFLAYVTLSTTSAWTSSGSSWSLCFMWSALVEINV